MRAGKSKVYIEVGKLVSATKGKLLALKTFHPIDFHDSKRDPNNGLVQMKYPQSFVVSVTTLL